MKHKIFQKFDIFFFIAIVAMTLFLALSARAQEKSEKQDLVSSGGAFTLEKAVVAGGGSSLNGQSLNLSGTIGQAIAGYRSTGGTFTLSSGFWTPENFAPTAAVVTAGGRVKTADGRGIKNARITIAFSSGEQRTIVSGTLGYYRFAEIPAGDTYVFSVSAKKYTFNQPTQIRNITDETQDIDFTADARSLPDAAAP